VSRNSLNFLIAILFTPTSKPRTIGSYYFRTTIDLSQVYKNSEKKLIHTLLINKLNIEIQEKVKGKIELPKIFYLRDEKIKTSIKEGIIFNYKKLLEQMPPQAHQNYVFKIDGITITQFKSGKLLIQGKPTNLSDQVYETISTIYREKSSEEFINKLSQQLSPSEFKSLKIELKRFQVSVDNYISQEIFDYLHPNDQIDLRDGIILVEWSKQYNPNFKNYGILVRNFAIVYEGFLIKLLIDLGVISQQEFERDVRVGQIGKVLKEKKVELESKISEYRRKYSYLPKKLEALWEECRNKILHSDYVAPHHIDSFEKANSKILEILDVIGKMFKVSNIPKRNSFEVIGTDESGKGDYFGPLVIAGVYVNSKAQLQKLDYLGVIDSKELSDGQILKLAKEIKKICKYDIVTINPKKYNELYQTIKNLNKLLAWEHSRVIENLLATVNCSYVISDQFGDESFIQNALMERGKKVILEQTPKAEENIVVAAASILAREEFLRRLYIMSRKFNVQFPKGASKLVEKAAKEFTRRYGKDKLDEIAKVHFKVTENLNA